MRTQDVRGILVFAVAAALAGTSAYLYVGPYRWLAELQLAVTGAYHVELSFLATLIACAVPLVVARNVLERRERRGDPEPELAVSRPWVGAATAAITASPRAAQAVLTGVALFGMGLFLTGRELTAGSLIAIDLATLERGEDPPSRYVELSGGELLGDRAVSFRDGIVLHHYAPYAAREGAAVAFVEISDRDRDGTSLVGPLRGLLERDGLPGPVRAGLEARAEIAEGHWVLRLGRAPDRAPLALGMAGSGLALLALGSAVVIVGRPRA